MADEEILRRRELTFLQAEGLAPLPTQMSGHGVTRKTRVSLLWLITQLDGDYGDETLLPLWTGVFGKYHDDMPANAGARQREIKQYIDGSRGADILNLIQFLSRSSLTTQHGYEFLQGLCEQERLSYRLIGKYGSKTDIPTLFPVASPEQAQALKRDLDTVAALGQTGARKHLAAAASALSSGDFPGSVRESIHAVESTVKIATGGKSSDLAGALKILDKHKPLHPALKQGLEKLYAWTSDEKGVRHALIDADASVTEAQAMFMLSACAAFSAWIARENIT